MIIEGLSPSDPKFIRVEHWMGFPKLVIDPKLIWVEFGFGGGAKVETDPVPRATRPKVDSCLGSFVRHVNGLETNSMKLV